MLTPRLKFWLVVDGVVSVVVLSVLVWVFLL
jgi:Tfp pilus assembly protein PilN